VGADKEMIDIHGHSHSYLHRPCSVCGYATRSRQYPIRCACNRNDPKPFTFPWENDPAWQEEIRQAKQRVAEWEQTNECRARLDR